MGLIEMDLSRKTQDFYQQKRPWLYNKMEEAEQEPTNFTIMSV